MPPTDPKVQHALVSGFCTRLALRPDRQAVRTVLAMALAEHAHQLFPMGDPHATPQWFVQHVDEVLAVMERLYSHATSSPVPTAFLDRMAWLPELVQRLDQPVSRDG